MTPNQIHYGRAGEVYAERQKVPDAAFKTNPNRFVGKPPNSPKKPTSVWINPPTPKSENQA